MLFINCVRAKEASCLNFVRVDYHGRIFSNFVLQELLRHLEKLVKIHSISVLHVALYFLLGLRVLSSYAKLIEFDPSIVGLTVVERLFNLDDLVLVESSVHVLLHLEVF